MVFLKLVESRNTNNTEAAHGRDEDSRGGFVQQEEDEEREESCGDDGVLIAD